MPILTETKEQCVRHCINGSWYLVKRTAWPKDTRTVRFEEALDSWTERRLTQQEPPFAGGVRAEVPALREPVRGGGLGRPDGQAAVGRVGAACAGGLGGSAGGAVTGELPGLVDVVLPRAGALPGGAAVVHVVKSRL